MKLFQSKEKTTDLIRVKTPKCHQFFQNIKQKYNGWFETSSCQHFVPVQLDKLSPTEFFLPLSFQSEAHTPDDDTNVKGTEIGNMLDNGSFNVPTTEEHIPLKHLSSMILLWICLPCTNILMIAYHNMEFCYLILNLYHPLMKQIMTPVTNLVYRTKNSF